MGGSQRAFLAGVGVGVGACLGAAAMIGAAGQPSSEERWITSSADGRTAYLWESRGRELRFVDSAEAKSRPQPRDHLAPDAPARPGEAAPGGGKPASPSRGR